MTTKTILQPDTQIGLVQIRVSNLERSLTFYQNVVGLSVLRQTGREVEMTADGQNVLLILREIENARVIRPNSVAGLYHFAILVPDRPSLGLVVRNLISSGIEVGQGDHLVSEALYIQDPDNNGIEIYRDRPKSEWKYDAEGHVMMSTDPVDVDGLLAASEGLSWNGLPAGTVIGHVHFHVGNLNKAKAFYVDLLGFELTANYGSAAMFISAGGYHHHIGLNVWAGQGAPAAPADTVGIDYFTLILTNEEERNAVVERVRQAGYAVTKVNGTPTFQDPWNIGIRLVLER
ncbi:glyoxalase [Paenibacillus odorifer]|uniref:VOC family protein n=1 Tax=Paenibacillus TaxID=44249 RepID=UPI00096C525B|nr:MULTISPECIES: VOC family protein [Paenibacillus]MDH6426718.1 catechol 2,3-dioxygenase [Paenibacillus sp. PastH-4]MDH6442744.1 catechol 2,3-dioxygenase [Paenibacillus sp. PastF-4]MDH6526546.1 catechol 2,3-dioxygenase [Paenibacillus sp. PastH-3]OMC75108.1 glyoxalase [Paenibacillus odorifer]OMD57853.1 glyoxalase [Paenibacillus odorifer]